MPEWLAAIVAIAGGVIAVAIPTLLLKFIIQKFTRKKNEDLFNPENVDGLLNEELQQTIEAVTADDTSLNRQALYKILLETTFCIPSSSSGEGTSAITATQNEEGEMVLVAFSDPVALRRWEFSPKAMLVMPAQQLFKLAVEQNFAEILINPDSQAGGKLAKRDFVRLAQGVIPESDDVSPSPLALHPEWLETPEVRELLSVLSRIEKGEEPMTRELLLRVVDTLVPWYFGTGVNLFAYNDASKTDEENAQVTSDDMGYILRVVEDWFDAWCSCSRPEWLFIFSDIVTTPPIDWAIDDEFCFFFLGVAKRFPNDAVQMISLLLNNEKTRPHAEEFLRALGEAVSGAY